MALRKFPGPSAAAKRYARGAALAAAVLFAAAGCGYHLRGTGSSLPQGIKSIAVPVFRNLTTRYELNLRLTRAVIDELVARGKVAVPADPGKADAVLEGEVASFTATPVAFTGQTLADRYTITVTAKIVLRERVSEKVIFSNPSFVYVQEYDVPQGRDFESVQTEAIDAVAGMFAKSLVVAILEGF